MGFWGYFLAGGFACGLGGCAGRLGGFAGGLLALLVLCVVIMGCYVYLVFSLGLSSFLLFFLVLVCACVLFLCSSRGEAVWCGCEFSQGSFCGVRSVISVSVQPQSGELLAEEDVDEGVVLAGVVGVDGDLDGGFGGEVVDGDVGFVGVQWAK